MLRSWLFVLVLLSTPPTWAQQSITTKFSGFANLAAGTNLTPNQGPSNGYDADWSIKPDSAIGLQARVEYQRKYSLTGQIISRGMDDFEPEINWLYASVQLTPSWNISIGRRQIPLFYYSDHIDVSYAYHWIRPPNSYNSRIVNYYDGADIEWQHLAGDWNLTVNAYGGQYDGKLRLFGVMPDPVKVDAEAKSFAGLTVSLQQDHWEFRVAAQQAILTLDIEELSQFSTLAASTTPQLADNMSIGDDRVRYLVASVVYDKQSWFTNAEAYHFDAPNTPLGTAYQLWLSGGLRRANFTYHATISYTRNEAPYHYLDSPASATTTGPSLMAEQAAHILDFRENKEWLFGVGTRWDFHPSWAAKAELWKSNQHAFSDRSPLIVKFSIDTMF